MTGFLQAIRNNRYIWIFAELLIIFILAWIRSPLLTPVILVFCAIELITKRITWEYLGFIKVKNILSVLVPGFLIAAAYQIVSIFLFVPVIGFLTGSPLDLSEITALRGNWANVLIALLISWTFAAFGEETAYRSFVYDRVLTLFPDRRLGSIVSVLFCTALFASGHGYQGLSGMMENFLFGLTMALVFIFSKKNLWLPAVIHGFVDTIGFTLILSGLYP